MGTKGFMLEEVAELPRIWAAEHLSPVHIEAGNSQNTCNDAVNSPLAKQTLFKHKSHTAFSFKVQT